MVSPYIGDEHYVRIKTVEEEVVVLLFVSLVVVVLLVLRDSVSESIYINNPSLK